MVAVCDPIFGQGGGGGRDSRVEVRHEYMFDREGGGGGGYTTLLFHSIDWTHGLLSSEGAVLGRHVFGGDGRICMSANRHLCVRSCLLDSLCVWSFCFLQKNQSTNFKLILQQPKQPMLSTFHVSCPVSHDLSCHVPFFSTRQ